jgi:L-lactate dehydrogenase complex protein LldG
LNSRDKVLARIRSQSGRSGTTTDLEISQARQVIAARNRAPIPSSLAQDPRASFKVQCANLKTTFSEVRAVDEVPNEVAAYLNKEGLTPNIVGWPAYSELDWQAAGVQFSNRIANASDLIGLTGSFCGVGETGTLMLLGSKQTPKLTSLLPETHICILDGDKILPVMEDAFQKLRDEFGEPPRSTFFVSGPSRTADIEQTLVIGAHGPYRVHVIIVS